MSGGLGERSIFQFPWIDGGGDKIAIHPFYYLYQVFGSKFQKDTNHGLYPSIQHWYLDFLSRYGLFENKEQVVYDKERDVITDVEKLSNGRSFILIDMKTSPSFEEIPCHQIVNSDYRGVDIERGGYIKTKERALEHGLWLAKHLHHLSHGTMVWNQKQLSNLVTEQKRLAMEAGMDSMKDKRVVDMLFSATQSSRHAVECMYFTAVVQLVLSCQNIQFNGVCSVLNDAKRGDGIQFVLSTNFTLNYVSWPKRTNPSPPPKKRRHISEDEEEDSDNVEKKKKTIVSTQPPPLDLSLSASVDQSSSSSSSSVDESASSLSSSSPLSSSSSSSLSSSSSSSLLASSSSSSLPSSSSSSSLASSSSLSSLSSSSSSSPSSHNQCEYKEFQFSYRLYFSPTWVTSGLLSKLQLIPNLEPTSKFASQLFVKCPFGADYSEHVDCKRVYSLGSEAWKIISHVQGQHKHDMESRFESQSCLPVCIRVDCLQCQERFYPLSISRDGSEGHISQCMWRTKVNCQYCGFRVKWYRNQSFSIHHSVQDVLLCGLLKTLIPELKPKHGETLEDALFQWIKLSMDARGDEHVRSFLRYCLNSTFEKCGHLVVLAFIILGPSALQCQIEPSPSFDAIVAKLQPQPIPIAGNAAAFFGSGGINALRGSGWVGFLRLVKLASA